MIEIFIKTPVSNPDLSFPESQKLPSEYVPEVWKKIQEQNFTIKIETVSSAIVNFVGHCIYYKKLLPEEAVIHFEGKEYFFDSEGILMDWPFGVLDSWFGEFSHWQFPDKEIKDVFNHEDYEDISGKKFQEKLIIDSLMDFTHGDDDRNDSHYSMDERYG
jgi:hypothetical protein